jgi:ribonuclease P protein component
MCGAEPLVQVPLAAPAIWKKLTAVNAIAPEGESNGNVEPSEERARFPRRLRLLRHADFERVYKQGRRHFSPSMTVFYLARSDAQAASSNARGPRLGFTVGRALGGAVERNRLKRRLREAVRLSRPLPKADVDIVINPKKSLLETDFAEVQKEVSRAFAVIEQKLGSKAV